MLSLRKKEKEREGEREKSVAVILPTIDITTKKKALIKQTTPTPNTSSIITPT